MVILPCRRINDCSNGVSLPNHFAQLEHREVESKNDGEHAKNTGFVGGINRNLAFDARLKVA
jgi:hypothetical protein